MMEIFLHYTSVAHVSGPNTSETLPPLVLLFPLLSPAFTQLFLIFFFGQIFFNPYEVIPCKITVAIRGHRKWPNLIHTHKPKTKINKSGSNRRSNRARYNIMVKKVPFSHQGHLLKILNKEIVTCRLSCGINLPFFLPNPG